MTTIIDDANRQNDEQRKLLINITSDSVRVFDTLTVISNLLSQMKEDHSVSCKETNSHWLETDHEWNGKPCAVRIREMLISMFEASNNKLAMKLYGNRNALMKERLRQRAANTWVIHPCSDFR